MRRKYTRSPPLSATANAIRNPFFSAYSKQARTPISTASTLKKGRIGTSFATALEQAEGTQSAAKIHITVRAVIR